MKRTIGVWAAEHIAVGLVEDRAVAGPLRVIPDGQPRSAALQEMSSERIVRCIAEHIEELRKGQTIDAVGVGFPGVILNGVVEESPNLQQMKGFGLQEALLAVLKGSGLNAPVLVLNDADAMAAGVAAVRGYLDQSIRVWTLGDGVGFGRYPWTSGVWEGGHSVVSLDPKEHYCGCGGQGHLEGIMGNRAMRLRFLDMEPEEVFANARAGDARCGGFVKTWHRALAAATATSIHMEGGGKFFIGGPNAAYLDTEMLKEYVHDMVKMSPLQSYMFEVFSSSDEIGVIGAGISAEQSSGGA
jgi:predicted NBD/HSP70 family sugar kinase